MGSLTLAVTGATGYLGQAVVARARAQGHRVRVFLRNAQQVPPVWKTDPGVELREGPLLSVAPETLVGVDAVLHLAAAMTGDDAVQERETLEPMRSVLTAIAACHPIPRLVLASSMSVYGGMREGDTVTESTSLETLPQARDAYTRAKLAQEALAKAHAAQHQAAVVILRIGAIWGPGRLWNGHLGVAMGPMLISMGTEGQIPLANRDRVAHSLVCAAEVPLKGVQIANVLDADLPDRRRFVAALRRGGWPRFEVRIGWPLMRALSVFGWVPGAPGLFRPRVQTARIMPLSYASRERWLSEPPAERFENAMNAALAAEGKTLD